MMLCVGGWMQPVTGLVDAVMPLTSHLELAAPGHLPKHVTFSNEIMGVPFPVASVVVHYARTVKRAQRVAELRLMRRRPCPETGASLP
jgi:hypothetical protein